MGESLKREGPRSAGPQCVKEGAQAGREGARGNIPRELLEGEGRAVRRYRREGPRQGGCHARQVGVKGTALVRGPSPARAQCWGTVAKEGQNPAVRDGPGGEVEGGVSGPTEGGQESGAKDYAGLGNEGTGHQPELGRPNRGGGAAKRFEGGPDGGDQVGMLEEFNRILRRGHTSSQVSRRHGRKSCRIVRLALRKESERDQGPARRPGGLQAVRESLPLGPAGRGEVFAVPTGWDTGARGGPARALAHEAVVPDGALEGPVLPALEHHTDGAQAGAAGRDGNSQVLTDDERRDGLAHEGWVIAALWRLSSGRGTGRLREWELRRQRIIRDWRGRKTRGDYGGRRRRGSEKPGIRSGKRGGQGSRCRWHVRAVRSREQEGRVRESRRGGRGECGRNKGRCNRDGRSSGKHGLDFGRSLVLVEGGALEDVLPPERKEELRVGAINVLGRLNVGERRGGAGQRGGDGGAVRGESLVLGPAGGGDLGNAPGGGAGGTGPHDVRDAIPEAVELGPAELQVAGEGDGDRRPLVAELPEEGVAGDELRKVRDGRRERSRAASGGQGEAALDRVKVSSVRQGQDELVAERSADGVVEERAGMVLPVRLLEFGALGGF